LDDGVARLALPPDLSFGKHTIKATYVPAKKGAKRTSATSALYWQREAGTVMRVNGKVIAPSDTAGVPVKGKAKFSVTLAKDDGSKLTGRAIVTILVKKGGKYKAVDTATVRIKSGKAVYTWKNTLAKGKVGRVQWDTAGGWGVANVIDFVSGKAPAADPADGDASGDGDSTSTSTPSPSDSPTGRTTALPRPPVTCHWECVQYGYGVNYGGMAQYGCLQRVQMCN
jgi:hypothetical protein